MSPEVVRTGGKSPMHEWHLHDLALALYFVLQHTKRMRDTTPKSFVLVSIQANYYAEHMCSILQQHLHILIMVLLPRSGHVVLAIYITVG